MISLRNTFIFLFKAKKMPSYKIIIKQLVNFILENCESKKCDEVTVFVNRVSEKTLGEIGMSDRYIF